jgi:hypothetical protein
MIEETSKALRVVLPEDQFSTLLSRGFFSENILFRFVMVEISKMFPYPLVRVTYTYSLGKDEKKGGLGLDTGKRVFLDHLEDPEVDAVAQKFASKISDYIGTTVLLAIQSRKPQCLPDIPSLFSHPE